MKGCGRLLLLGEELQKKLKTKNLLAVLFGVESRFTFFQAMLSCECPVFNYVHQEKRSSEDTLRYLFQ